MIAEVPDTNPLKASVNQRLVEVVVAEFAAQIARQSPPTPDRPSVGFDSAGPSSAGCSFLGKFTARGDLGGTVESVGHDAVGKSWSHRQTVTGLTSVSAPSDGSAQVSIRTTSDGIGRRLPASDDEHHFSGNTIGRYEVVFVPGPAYNSWWGSRERPHDVSLVEPIPARTDVGRGNGGQGSPVPPR